MGAQLKYGTAGATGGGFNHQPGSLQPGYAEFRHEPRWSMQQRSPKTWKDKNSWSCLWPTSRFCGGGDIGQGYAPIGQDLSASGMFESFSCDGAGTQTKNFLRGVCKDSTSAIVANAIVQGFVTGTDAFVGEVTAGADGTYLLGTEQLKSTPHYLVAYKPGAPDIAGTTVNTLLPTNVDGS